MKENFYKALATGFFSGYIPFAPGTFGSLLGIIFYILTEWISYPIQIFIFLIYIFLAYKSIPYALKIFKEEDPAKVVCDEIIGMWLSLIFFQVNLYQIAIAFLIFRFFDILKPFPIRQIEKRVKGATGIILDDILAALYTKIVLWIIISGSF